LAKSSFLADDFKIRADLENIFVELGKTVVDLVDDKNQNTSGFRIVGPKI